MQIRTALIIGLTLFSSLNMVQADNAKGLIQTERYSAVEPDPTTGQAAPLLTLVTIKYPRQVNTVGHAISYTLKRSGYRLAPQHAHDPNMKVLIKLPLPEVHRQLGPMSVKQILNTLSGSAFMLVTDPVHRYISFELIPEYRSLVLH
jgi:type IV pili sensor histidine kinase/response regulator